MIRLVTLKFSSKCKMCHEEMPVNNNASRFIWKNKSVLACEICTEKLLPKLHPNFTPPK
jgi:hypothetical protein